MGIELWMGGLILGILDGPVVGMGGRDDGGGEVVGGDEGVGKAVVMDCLVSERGSLLYCWMVG